MGFGAGGGGTAVLACAKAAIGRCAKKPGFWEMKSCQPPGVSTAWTLPSRPMVEVARRSMKSRSWLTRIRVPS